MKISTIDSNSGSYLANDEKSKEMLYRDFSPKMYGICLRFAGNKMEADDILHEGFIKIFTKIKDFRNEGSLEGWIRRTIINTAINYYRRNRKYAVMNELEGVEKPAQDNTDINDRISHEELLGMIQELPVGYRTVFNLNVLEGYTHKEIGEMLNISDNTSKSQLTRARLALQKKVKHRMMEKVKVPFEHLRVVKRNDREKIELQNDYLEAV